MPRDRNARENHRRLKALRGDALRRIELGQPTSPREPPAGVTSMPIKMVDESVLQLIREYEARLSSRSRIE